ncbi:MAG: hypothetical protein MZU84_00810 [Sphingobacterium sp.]|nr:hypothetical protein [Sphingobacterium sp.]
MRPRAAAAAVGMVCPVIANDLAGVRRRAGAPRARGARRGRARSERGGGRRDRRARGADRGAESRARLPRPAGRRRVEPRADGGGDPREPSQTVSVLARAWTSSAPCPAWWATRPSCTDRRRIRRGGLRASSSTTPAPTGCTSPGLRDRAAAAGTA